ncbi:MAG: PhoX family phosphatase [Burkholderiales bacterium]|nr:PhoX family phosphatase [Burkholderiales bacterium]
MHDGHCGGERAALSIERLIELRISRRDVLKAAVLGAATVFSARTRAAHAAASASTLTFTEIAHGLDETHHLPPGYSAQVVLRWGDPLFPDAPAFVPGKPDAQGQEKQFGYDNDYLAFLPLPRASTSASHGLLCVNHERCTPQLMWPGMTARDYARHMNAEHCAHEMAAQGFSVVEVRFQGGRWQAVLDSRYNRRITARGPAIAVAGPAAGHRRLKTKADPSGGRVLGTFNNCAGGVTPWGSVLTCEENVHMYFFGDAARHPEAAALKRYGIDGRGRYVWGRYDPRFRLERTPNEPNRFGWVVEIDPYEPQAAAVKRTALGRFKHEGASAAVSHDARVAIYMGDDEAFEYLYKFVSEGRFVPGDPNANRDLLDRGTLYAARFETNGRMRWLPLVYGRGPLTRANGFASQADVVIEARRAADLAGATRMDRPEDVETNPINGHVYVVLTKNPARTRAQVNAANPRAHNKWGHIIEIIPPRVDGASDHGAAECRWEFFLLAGDPQDAKQSARYAGPISSNGWLACPDNVAFDPRGRIWIATDGQDEVANLADSLYAADTSGSGRGSTRLFFNGPRGAEICGPCFTLNGNTLFVAVQHPGDERDSTFDQPSTRWPDFRTDTPPRPAVLAITKHDGGEIGS